MMRERQFYKTAVLLTLAVYFWVGINLVWGDKGQTGVTLCLFKRITGIACPSCGLTRSILALLHGDAGSAFLINPLGMIVLPMLFILPGWLFRDYVRSEHSLYRATELFGQIVTGNRRIGFIAGALLVFNWGWNIIKAM